MPAFSVFYGCLALLLHLQISYLADAPENPSEPNPVSIESSPTNQILSIGSRLELSVAAFGPSPISYQWRQNGLPILGATNKSLIITNISREHFASYDVLVADSTSSLLSQPATVMEAGLLEVATAIELTFYTEVGKSYELQSSPDLVTWETMDARVLGTGVPFKRLFSAHPNLPAYFRLRNYEPAQPPTLLASKRIMFTYLGGREHFDLLMETSGTYEDRRGCTYTWDFSTTTIELVLTSGEQYHINLDFYPWSSVQGTASVTYQETPFTPVYTDAATFILYDLAEF